MVAFTYRMGAGFAGDINRTHPATVEPVMFHSTTPPLFYGEPCLVDAATGTLRAPAAGDTAVTDVYGITVRPYPTQSGSPLDSFGTLPLGGTAASPPHLHTPGDVLRSGYIMARVNGAAVKGGAVFVWVAATAAPHVQGGFETAASAGNTMAITGSRTTFNGVPDANGITEIAFNI